MFFGARSNFTANVLGGNQNYKDYLKLGPCIESCGCTEQLNFKFSLVYIAEHKGVRSLLMRRDMYNFCFRGIHAGNLINVAH